VAELMGAFCTARATPVIALGSTFIDFTPSWMKDFAIATFGTNDKVALFVGMAVTILLLACVLGIVAYRKWALGVAGVLLMGAVIVGSVVTRAGVKPLDALPTLIGTVAGLIALRFLNPRLWRKQPWPGPGSARQWRRPYDKRFKRGNCLGTRRTCRGLQESRRISKHTAAPLLRICCARWSMRSACLSLN